MRKPKSDYAIQTVVNAMRVLEAFRDEEELGVTEISRRLGLHKNNVFRLLATLEQQGYIEQSSDNERYRLGGRSLGCDPRRKRDSRRGRREHRLRHQGLDRAHGHRGAAREPHGGVQILDPRHGRIIDRVPRAAA